jgi:hypothetical protein
MPFDDYTRTACAYRENRRLKEVTMIVAIQNGGIFMADAAD